MKLINRHENFKFDDNLIEKFTKKFNIHDDVVKTVIASGYDTEEKIDKFLNPSEKDLYDPFLLNDMQKAVDRINEAINNDEHILIYGDYDVDGVCATTILMLSLLKRTENVSYFLPDRKNHGYGLSEKSIEYVMEEYNPDLIITVDCGITNIQPVEYVFDLGVDIIVTDHHEPKEILPNCLCIDPKLNGYPFPGLSGAGVAFKLANALENKIDSSYIDIVAISTVADLMPLVDENRYLVKMGLEILNTHRRKCIEILIEACNVKELIDEVTIGYILAPKINALGRLSNPMKAVTLFLTDDENEMKNIIDVLLHENTKRQKLTSDFLGITEKIIKDEKLLDKKCILVHSDKFVSGISGLVASNLTNMYNRPSIVFTENGEFLVGSARSVEGINMFELLTEIKDNLIVKFGGHAGAAGVTIYKDDFDEFVSRVDKYIDENVDTDVFEEKIKYDIDVTNKNIDMEYVKAFNTLAPFGLQNEKPVFIERVQEVHPVILKGNAHMKFKVDNIDFIYFNGAPNLDLFEEKSEKIIAFDLYINSFNGTETVSGKVNTLLTNLEKDYEKDYRAFKQLEFTNKGEISPLKETEWMDKLDNSLVKPFSTLILVNNKDEYIYFTEKLLPKLKNKENIFSIKYKYIPRNNLNSLVIFPEVSVDFNNFTDIFFVGCPYANGFINYVKNVNIHVLDKKFFSDIKKIDLSRDVFGKYYLLLKKNVKLLSGGIMDIYETLSRVENIDLNQLVICYMVFSNLGLIIRNLNDTYTIPDHIKVELNNSNIYTTLLEIKEKLN